MKMKKSRLKRNKGSVLAIVLIVMTVLMLAASAMYYTIQSVGEQIHTDYKTTQTYLTALSVTDLVADAIMYDELGSGANLTQLKDAVKDDLTTVGDKITLTPSATDLEKFGGMADMSITGGVPDGVTVLVENVTPVGLVNRRHFKVVSTIKYDGKEDVVEKIIELDETPSTMSAPFTETMLATGKHTSNTRISMMEISAMSKYYNPLVKFGKAGFTVNGGDGVTSENVFYSDLSIEGTFKIEEITIANSWRGEGDTQYTETEPNEWYIGQNLVINGTGADTNFGLGSFKPAGATIFWGWPPDITHKVYPGKIVTGQNLYLNSTAFTQKHRKNAPSVYKYTDIKVLGDLVITNQMQSDIYGNVFVNGNVENSTGTVTAGGETVLNSSSLPTDKTITVHGNIKSNSLNGVVNASNGTVMYTCADGKKITFKLCGNTHNNCSDCANQAGFNTKYTVGNWDYTDLIATSDKLTQKIAKPTFNELKIKNSNLTTSHVIDLKSTDQTYSIGGSGTLDLKYTEEFRNGITIEPYFIEIDTDLGAPLLDSDGNTVYMEDGVTPAKITYLRLKPNCKDLGGGSFIDGGTTNDSFRWRAGNLGLSGSDSPIYVLTKGKGIVVFDMAPIGSNFTKYVSSEMEYIGPDFLYQYYEVGNNRAFGGAPLKMYESSEYTLYAHTYYLPQYTDAGYQRGCADCLTNFNNGVYFMDHCNLCSDPSLCTHKCPHAYKLKSSFSAAAGATVNMSDNANIYNFIFSGDSNNDGIQMDSKTSTLCGYIYTPNLTFTSVASSGGVVTAQSGNTALIGAVIANSYDIHDSRNFVFIKPDPTIVDAIFGSMDGATDDDDDDTSSLDWNTIGYNR